MWPNILFLLHKLAQFLFYSYLVHKSALQKVFGYIKYMISFGIRYAGEQIYSNLGYFIINYNIIGYVGIFKKGDLQAFTDADHASDLVD